MNHSPEKSCFRSLQSLLLPQFSTYRHQTGFIVKRKQTGAYYQLSLNTYKFVKIKCKILKVVYFVQKNMCISNNSIKFIIIFFQKEIIRHTYIFIKCIDNFKFSISLKSYEEFAYLLLLYFSQNNLLRVLTYACRHCNIKCF